MRARVEITCQKCGATGYSSAGWKTRACPDRCGATLQNREQIDQDRKAAHARERARVRAKIARNREREPDAAGPIAAKVRKELSGGPGARGLRWLRWRASFVRRWCQATGWRRGDPCVICGQPATRIVVSHVLRRSTHQHLIRNEQNVVISCDRSTCPANILDLLDEQSVSKRLPLIRQHAARLLRGRAPWLARWTVAQFVDFAEKAASAKKIPRRGESVVR